MPPLVSVLNFDADVKKRRRVTNVKTASEVKIATIFCVQFPSPFHCSHSAVHTIDRARHVASRHVASRHVTSRRATSRFCTMRFKAKCTRHAVKSIQTYGCTFHTVCNLRNECHGAEFVFLPIRHRRWCEEGLDTPMYVNRVRVVPTCPTRTSKQKEICSKLAAIHISRILEKLKLKFEREFRENSHMAAMIHRLGDNSHQASSGWVGPPVPRVPSLVSD